MVQPYKGWLYYVELIGQTYDVYVVDMETDSIVDSIDVPRTHRIPGVCRRMVNIWRSRLHHLKRLVFIVISTTRRPGTSFVNYPIGWCRSST